MKNANTFSIIIANYNGGKYIETAIASLINQSTENWNLIIVDDASSDDSILKIGKFLYNKRIKLICHELNKGYTVALKTAIASVETGIFGLLDSDDALAPNAIEVMRKAHLDNPKCGLIYSQFAYCDENLKPKKVGYCKEIPENKSNLDTNGVSHFKTFKINYYLKTTGYDESILYSEDKDISYKIEEVAGLKFIDKILYFYRTLSNSVSHINENRELSFETMMKAKSNAIKRRIENSVIANREALDLFKKGLDYLYNLEFSKATEIIKEYRTKINYNSFVKYCNSEINNPSLSIIIVAFNTNQLLIDCIESLKNQDNKNFEIIVVDNGQNEQVLEKLLSYQILYIRNPYNFILSEGRNIGTHFAKAKIISFLDDDAVVPDNYVSSILKAFQLPDVLAIRGKVLPKNSSLKIPESYDLGDKPVPSCITAEGNSAYLKEVYLRLNGMNPLLFGHEGLDFSYRLFETDQKIHSFYWPDTIIFHNPADEYKNELKSQRYEIMNSFLVWLHPNIWQFHELLNRYTSNNITMPAVLIDQRSEVPVVLITYNRPNHTKKVLESLRVNNIKNLFIFSDAPKEEKDVEAVKQTRELFNSIDWTVPNITFQNINQGLAKSITNAVDTVFKKFDKVILLEDDCVPQEYFFEFMYDCLNEYQHNERVFGISGYTVPIPEILLKDYPYDIYFSPRIGSWGWATWKRAWKRKNDNLNILYEELKNNKIDLNQGGNDVPGMLQQLIDGKLHDVWTMSWLLTVYLNKGYYIYPTKSHILNIGMDGTGVHCGPTKKYDTIASTCKSIRFSEEIKIEKNIHENFRRYYDVNPNSYSKKEIDINNRIKVVHLCTQDFGGAGKAAYRLHKGLQAIGVDSIFIVLDKHSGDPSVKVIPDYDQRNLTYCDSFETYNSTRMRLMWRHWSEMLNDYPNRPAGLEISTDTSSSVKLNYIREILEADVINLHWVAGMINFVELPRLLKGKKIVWTLHDMNPFTGGCHYSSSCNKYLSKCEDCPQLGSDDSKDMAQSFFLDKKNAYDNLDFNIVAPSRWLRQEAGKSTLFSQFSIDHIPYGLPLDIFKPMDKTAAKKMANVNNETKVILFGAENIQNKRKGLKYLIDALKNLDESTQSEILVLTFGSGNLNLPSTLKFQYKNIGSVTDQNILSAIYSIADVFVIPSLEDNLPNTVLEALACGTPVVGFNIGGIPDMISHLQTGYLAYPGDVKDLANGIDWALINSEKISPECRKFAEDNYELKIQANAYLNKYKLLLEKGLSNKPALHESAQVLQKISVITPSFNQGKFIEQTIKSVLDQKYENFEHLIIDGGSTDETIGILKKHSHLKWISEKDKGQSDAVNKGLKLATGEIIAWINSDDWYEPEVFNEVVRFFYENPDKNIVMGNCNLVDKNGKIFDRVINIERGFEELKNYRVSRSIPTQPAIFFRKKLIDEFGLLDINIKYVMDYDLWMRFATKNKFFHINQTFANYRFHEDAKIGDSNWSKVFPECEAVRQRYVSAIEDPLVSVVIPCFNYARYLSESVESVVNQVYKKFEIIIVNDGSTDNTIQVTKNLIKNFPSIKIKLINQSNSGHPSISRNKGIKEAIGEYILPLDADDKIHPWMLVDCIREIQSGSPNRIIYTARQDFDGSDSVIIPSQYNFEKLKRENHISYCALYPKKMWKEIGGYRTNVGMEDWDFWIAAGLRGYWGCLIPKPLFFYRRHDSGQFQKDAKNVQKILAKIIINNAEAYNEKEFELAKQYLSLVSENLLVSVIIPTYNRPDDLRNAIQSVLNQTYKNFELVIVNDAGTDVEHLVKEFNNNKIKYIVHKKNKGLAAARNTGLKSAKGKYIAFLDDDDIFYENHLETAISELKQNEKVVYTDAVRATIKKENGKNTIVNKSVPYSIDYDRNKLLIGNIAPVNCFVFEKSLADKAGLFDESLPVLEDWDFWLKLSSITSFKHIKKETVQVNWLDDGSTMTSSKGEAF